MGGGRSAVEARQGKEFLVSEPGHVGGNGEDGGTRRRSTIGRHICATTPVVAYAPYLSKALEDERNSRSPQAP